MQDEFNLVFANDLCDKFYELEHQLYHCTKDFNHAWNSRGQKFNLPQRERTDSLRCPKCGRNFTTLFNLQRHSEICNPNKNKKRKTIGEKLNLPHRKKNDSLRCPKCGRDFPKKFNLQRHSKICNPNKNKQWKTRGTPEENQMKTSKKWKTREQKLNLPHRKKNDSLRCPKCGRDFPKKFNLQRHSKICNPNKNKQWKNGGNPEENQMKTSGKPEETGGKPVENQMTGGKPEENQMKTSGKPEETARKPKELLGNPRNYKQTRGAKLAENL